MLLAYIDESGNTGDPTEGGTLTFTLGCVLVSDATWPKALDEMLDFRRRLREKFGVSLGAEIKANSLLRNSGEMRDFGLGPSARKTIYRAHLRVLTTLGARAFAVVIDKRNGWTSPGNCFELAWNTLLQRLERTSTHERETFLVVHDEGENDQVRRLVRRARRHLTAGSLSGSGSLNHPFAGLIDDPVPRRSHSSYFIQAADLVAYAAFRSVVPPGVAIASVCPETHWTELGEATHRAVNSRRPQAAPGIVLR